MREVQFVNFTLKFPTELYVTEELPDVQKLFSWQEKLEREVNAKFGGSYNVDKSSFIASYTDRSGKTSEPDYCTTAFGGSKLSALQKLYVVVEVLGYREYGEEVARINLEQVEFQLAKALKEAMRK